MGADGAAVAAVGGDAGAVGVAVAAGVGVGVATVVGFAAGVGVGVAAGVGAGVALVGAAGVVGSRATSGVDAQPARRIAVTSRAAWVRTRAARREAA